MTNICATEKGPSVMVLRQLVSFSTEKEQQNMMWYSLEALLCGASECSRFYGWRNLKTNYPDTCLI